MQTHQLKRNHPNMKRMTVARGGKRGKTAGRGGKGQSARAGNKRRPEWRDIVKKLPKLRGRGVNQHKPVSDVYLVVNLAMIDGAFNAGEAVTPTILIEKGILSTWSGRTLPVKILGDGELKKALKVSGFAVSASAKAAIEKAGGSVAPVPSRVVAKNKGSSGQKRGELPPAPAVKKAEAKKPVKAEKKAKPAKEGKADGAKPAAEAKKAVKKPAAPKKEKA
jgi:large subunit ribosomal protein L15